MPRNVCATVLIVNNTRAFSLVSSAINLNVIYDEIPVINACFISIIGKPHFDGLRAIGTEITSQRDLLCFALFTICRNRERSHILAINSDLRFGSPQVMVATDLDRDCTVCSAANIATFLAFCITHFGWKDGHRDVSRCCRLIASGFTGPRFNRQVKRPLKAIGYRD